MWEACRNIFSSYIETTGKIKTTVVFSLIVIGFLKTPFTAFYFFKNTCTRGIWNGDIFKALKQNPTRKNFYSWKLSWHFLGFSHRGCFKFWCLIWHVCSNFKIICKKWQSAFSNHCWHFSRIQRIQLPKLRFWQLFRASNSN